MLRRRCMKQIISFWCNILWKANEPVWGPVRILQVCALWLFSYNTKTLSIMLCFAKGQTYRLIQGPRSSVIVNSVVKGVKTLIKIEWFWLLNGSNNDSFKEKKIFENIWKKKKNEVSKLFQSFKAITKSVFTSLYAIWGEKKAVQ